MTNQQVTDTDLLKKTQAYPVIDAKLCATDKFVKVPDLLTGNRRKRRYAMVISLSGIPNFSEQPEPIIMPPQIQTVLIDSDTFEDLRERVVAEVDAMIEEIKTAINEAKDKAPD